MSQASENYFPLVTRLICALIDNERELELRANELPRRVNWIAKVGINDTGKLIGGGARHVRSLRAVLSVIGSKHGEDWRFIAENPEDGERRTEFERRGFNPNHLPGEELALLRLTLEAMLTTPPAIDLLGGDGEYQFTINCGAVQDYEVLATPVTVGFNTLTPIAALGTLWKAYAQQQGARYTVHLPSR